ncbi:MAG: AbrB/MazE/SpoVT family DNA-binding domain-containing protein [Ottowia sp.]|uniref:AbrB/MazE/SpoVT family DNA-binding domain-containing protein n=1 Tax=Ottowia sp. TaxID=1898956 RepID=UPI0039E4D0D5
MHATVSNKGQVTLPKAIRNQLGLVEGTRLDLDIVDGAIRARPISRTALDIFGALHRPGARPVSVEDMARAIEAAAVARFAATTTDAPKAAGRRKKAA